MQYGCKKLVEKGAGGGLNQTFSLMKEGAKLIKEDGLPWEGGLNKELTECIICN